MNGNIYSEDGQFYVITEDSQELELEKPFPWYRVIKAFSSKLQRYKLNTEFWEGDVHRLEVYPTTTQLIALGLLLEIPPPAAPPAMGAPQSVMMRDEEEETADEPTAKDEEELAAADAALEDEEPARDSKDSF